MKKLVTISNSLLLGINILAWAGLLWFGTHSTPSVYARAARVSHQPNELDCLSAEVAAERQK